MEIEKFVEKTIEGGWCAFADNVSRGEVTVKEARKAMLREMSIEQILLDPKAWKAVGKVEGWREDGKWNEWEQKMHGLTAALIEGKSLKEYIKTL